jgi:hypothetical protein
MRYSAELARARQSWENHLTFYGLTPSADWQTSWVGCHAQRTPIALTPSGWLFRLLQRCGRQAYLRREGTDRLGQANTFLPQRDAAGTARGKCSEDGLPREARKARHTAHGESVQ